MLYLLQSLLMQQRALSPTQHRCGWMLLRMEELVAHRVPSGLSYLRIAKRKSQREQPLKPRLTLLNSFTLIFDQYVASIGPGVSITQTRKNCQINLDLRYPGGFQYSVFNTIYRGYVGLDRGVSATQSATYYFSGRKLFFRNTEHLVWRSIETSQSTAATSFYGPISKDYEVQTDIDLTSVVWSPCGAPVALNIDSALLLRSSVASASGLITDDSIDGKVTFIVGVQWQKC